MSRPRVNPMRRLLPDTVRQRLEVVTAMSWEAVVSTHTRYARHFLDMMRGRLAVEAALARYVAEMEIPRVIESAVSTRILADLEGAGLDDAAAEPAIPFRTPEDESDGWRRFRPDVVVRGVLDRQRRSDETERWVQLLIARAEEGLILTHVENTITFAALLDTHLPFDRAIQEYLGAMNLTGSRAQVVYQRSMARLADVYLPASAPAAHASGRES
jgi:hypothetical protein